MELPEKVVTLDDTDHPYEKIAALDCSSGFESKPAEDDLRFYAQSYLETTANTEPDIDIDIDFAQLWQTPGYEDIAEAERVSLCDTVHVYVSKLGIEVSTTVTETEYDCLLERYKFITLSNSTLTSRNDSLSSNLVTTATFEKVEQKVNVFTRVITTVFGWDYVEKKQVRTAFAADNTSITIKSGVITFDSNTISIDSDNFKLTTSGEVDAKGVFTSGSDTSYKMVMTGGQITGYYKETKVGTISMSASHDWTEDDETETYRGVSIEGDNVKLEGKLVDINADYLNINYDESGYYYGCTGTVTVATGWEWTTHKVITDLNIDLDSGTADWSWERISMLSSIEYKTLRFQKGLLVTSLG